MDYSETAFTTFLYSEMEPNIISYYCLFCTLHSVKFKLPTLCPVLLSHFIIFILHFLCPFNACPIPTLSSKSGSCTLCTPVNRTLNLQAIFDCHTPVSFNFLLWIFPNSEIQHWWKELEIGDKIVLLSPTYYGISLSHWYHKVLKHLLLTACLSIYLVYISINLLFIFTSFSFTFLLMRKMHIWKILSGALPSWVLSFLCNSKLTSC